VVSKKLTALRTIIKVFKTLIPPPMAHFRNLDQFGNSGSIREMHAFDESNPVNTAKTLRKSRALREWRATKKDFFRIQAKKELPITL
jgi:hypothetical protein